MPFPILIRSICVWLVLLGQCLLAQQSLPDRPTDYILDDARSLHDVTREQLSQEMALFAMTYGIEVFLDTNTFLPQDIPTLKRARALIEHWTSKEKPGLVLCLNRGQSPIPVMQYNQQMQKLLPDGDLITLSRQVAVNVDATMISEEKMPIAVRTVMQKLEELFKIQQQERVTLVKKEWLLAAALTAAMALFSLLGYALLRRLEVDEFADLEELELPDVEVAQRFGAPCGGGVIAEISYAGE
jgi:hypothetical protein